MADKPRVKAPRQRTATPASDSDRRRRLAILAGAGGALVAAGIVALVVLGFNGGGGGSAASAQSALEAAGCTLTSYPGVSRAHISNPNARLKQWSSFPPTSGPHYATAAIYGFYSQPLQPARVLHNLEHGGMYIFYGSKAPPDTVSKLRKIYDQDPRGLIVAPLPELDKTIALGAWTSDNPGSADVGTGHLARCTAVNEKAFDAFINAFRAHGPEGAPLSALQPGTS